MQDALTDLSATPEVIPGVDAVPNSMAHRGILRTALNVRDVIVNNHLLEAAFERYPVSIWANYSLLFELDVYVYLNDVQQAFWVSFLCIQFTINTDFDFYVLSSQLIWLQSVDKIICNTHITFIIASNLQLQLNVQFAAFINLKQKTTWASHGYN